MMLNYGSTYHGTRHTTADFLYVGLVDYVLLYRKKRRGQYMRRGVGDGTDPC